MLELKIELKIEMEIELEIKLKIDFYWVFISCHNTYRDAFADVSPYRAPESRYAQFSVFRSIPTYFSMSVSITP